jgi:flagellar hook assembly protein FlgD
VALLLAVVLAVTAAALSPLGAGVAHGAARLKAVVIVGPSSGMQSGNLASGEYIAAVAESYGMDVRRVFHPNATWSAVLANIQGASIVVYLGHGNGWPSPYAPFQTSTKDGFGLNPIAGGSAYSVQYYGEGPIAASVGLAPNAVVVLNHACYTAGSSEPGQAAPSLAVAQERVDNYAAGFLRAGARAVFAYSHGDVSPVIRDLFTTRDTIDEIFMGSGYNGGLDVRFPSLRSPGYDVHMDPESSGGYYRSVVGSLSLTADQVTGAPFSRTDGAPTDFVVPGNATVAATGTAEVLDAPGGAVVGSLGAGTPVRVAAGPLAGADGRAYLTISSPTYGFVATDQLTPADSTGPRAWDVDADGGAFSPNGDGSADTLPVTITWSEPAAWTARLERADGAALASWSGSGETASFAWDGLSGGTALPDGTYRLIIVGTDTLGNVGSERIATLRVDTVAPTLLGAPAAATPAAPRVFTPNGDGTTDTLPIGYDISEAGSLAMTVRSAAGIAVRTATINVAAGVRTVTWDGRDDAGAYVPEGSYGVELRPRDLAGNVGQPIAAAGLALTSVRSFAVTPGIFFPADGDGLAPSVRASFTITSAAVVDWTLTGPDGSLVATPWSAQPTVPGSYSWTWTGQDAAGAKVKEGLYRTTITSTTAAGVVTYRGSFWVGAFRMTPSKATLTRGKKVTVTILTAEPLLRNPSLTITQPGATPYVLSTTRVTSTTYRATFTVRSGATGSARMKAYGIDVNGRSQASYLTVPVN